MKTIIIGLDAFDPKVFERLNAEGKLPNLGKYAAHGGYSRFEVASPPQSEVSWTSIATGLDPGAHGIFDFVHRNPETYALEVSLLPTKKSAVGLQFVPPHKARTLFEAAVDDGFPATALWWPATFPAKLDSPVRTIPGLGAPDILGRLGVGTLFSTSAVVGAGDKKTSLKSFELAGEGTLAGALDGPLRKTRKGSEQAQADFVLEVKENSGGVLVLGKQKTELKPGEWSRILEIPFKVGFGITLKAVTRAILTSIGAETRLYFLPLQIHPLYSAWPYGASKGFVKDLWQKCGPFLTLGWPQDTTGLEDGCIDDGQFLDLCDLIFEERQRVFFYLLDKFNEGVLAGIFDTLDRLQHMFWGRSPEVVERWYQKLDELVGRVEAQAGEGTRILVVSDHGFDRFDNKVHLNRWLEEHGYLVKVSGEAENNLKNVDWSQSKAY
ncbi:MAG: alkaline phosphatase family protein, partial [Anaerolineae bacterium]|nr:alkaline phosphatase family protein [Anaerolineae bacterium]